MPGPNLSTVLSARFSGKLRIVGGLWPSKSSGTGLVVRYSLLLLVAVLLFASISGSKAGPRFGPPRRGSPGGVAYSEHHHRPYYYRRYYYAPTRRRPRPHR